MNETPTPFFYSLPANWCAMIGLNDPPDPYKETALTYDELMAHLKLFLTICYSYTLAGF